ncbi:MAG: D-inositol 3-phosphate glycosyltransferase [Chlamydiae bacterium]|nr:D-inositol 3-phosphate glycosyltransferase [Chlamydiota bacterium]
MVRLALITDQNIYGGGESNLFYLAKEFSNCRNLGVEVEVFTPDEHLHDLLRKENIKTHLFSKFWMRSWIKGFPIPFYSPKILRFLKHFDLVHAYSVTALPLLFYLRRPLVWTSHGFWERPYGLRGKFINFFTNHIIGISQEAMNKFSFPLEKTSYIPNGIVIDNRSLKPFPILTQHNHLTISCIGRMQHIKGQDVLLESLPIVLQNFPDKNITVNFIGGANPVNRNDKIYFNKVVEKGRELNKQHKRLNIQFHAFQEDIVPFIDASDLIVSPSRYESFGMVPLEALSRGRPVVVPDIGGPKEIFVSKSYSERFVPNSSISLAQAMCKWLNALDTFDLEKALSRAHQFSVKKQAEALAIVYKKIRRE